MARMRIQYAFIVLLGVCLISKIEAKRKGKAATSKTRGIALRKRGEATAKDSGKKGSDGKHEYPKVLNWVSKSHGVFQDSVGDVVISHHAPGAAKKDKIDRKRIGVRKVKKILKRSIKSVLKKHRKKNKVHNKLVYQNGKIKMYQDQNGDYIMSHHERHTHRKTETPRKASKTNRKQ